MNRILSNYGRKFIKAKLERFTEEFGIKITYINAAYTSQECNSFHYIDKRNRINQREFLCKHCGLKINADVNAPRVMITRSSCEAANLFLSTKKVLRIRVAKFLSEQGYTWGSTRYHSLTIKQADNPYLPVYKEIAAIDHIRL